MISVSWLDSLVSPWTGKEIRRVWGSVVTDKGKLGLLEKSVKGAGSLSNIEERRQDPIRTDRTEGPTPRHPAPVTDYRLFVLYTVVRKKQ
jgi:hypothetical protein